MMDEEERDDTQMKEHFTDRWTRTPSSKLTLQLREEGGKYRNILDNATSADGVVKEKYNTHRRGLEILSKSDDFESYYLFLLPASLSYPLYLVYNRPGTSIGQYWQQPGARLLP